ncbi:MAG: hypothetical protein R2932_14715 [Caldilineaceae bacterium]
MQRGEQYDGNPYISDGDVLGFSGVVCARNKIYYPPLPWAAIYPIWGWMRWRSSIFPATLLPSPPSSMIRRASLRAAICSLRLAWRSPTWPSSTPLASTTIGLDGVQFIGERERIIKFVNGLANVPRDAFLEAPERLRRLLEELDIDIWFSTEGTYGDARDPKILDGDLLSVRTATIIANNGDLLPATVPAGLPNRGVDFGLDAVVAASHQCRRLVKRHCASPPKFSSTANQTLLTAIFWRLAVASSPRMQRWLHPSVPPLTFWDWMR